jgi:hypothetical protein
VSESTDQHDYAAAPAVPVATFQEPQEPDVVRGLTTREVLNRQAQDTAQRPEEAWTKVQERLQKVNEAARKVEQLLPGADAYAAQLAAAAHHPDDPKFRHLDGSPSQIPRDVDDFAPAPTGEVPATPPPPAGGPVPILEGTFAIFLAPDESIVVAYRPRGADDDKRFVVPAFIVSMATRQSGYTPAQIFDAIKEGSL